MNAQSAPQAVHDPDQTPAIRVRGLVNRFGAQVVHD